MIHWELCGGRLLHRFSGYLERERGRESNPYESHYDAVWGVAFRGDGEAALSGTPDQAALLWDLTDGKLLRRYANFKAGLFGAASTQMGAPRWWGGWTANYRCWNTGEWG